MKKVSRMTCPTFIWAAEKSDSLKRYGYLILTADKGLSGAYNHNIVKLVQPELDKHPEQNNLYVAGRMGRHYYRTNGCKCYAQFPLHCTGIRPWTEPVL